MSKLIDIIKNCRLVSFDGDGTLFDTFSLGQKWFAAISEEFNWDEEVTDNNVNYVMSHPREYSIALFSMGSAKKWRSANPSDVNKANEIYYILQKQCGIELFPRVPELLHLRKDIYEMQIALTTNTKRVEAEFNIRKLHKEYKKLYGDLSRPIFDYIRWNSSDLI